MAASQPEHSPRAAAQADGAAGPAADLREVAAPAADEPVRRAPLRVGLMLDGWANRAWGRANRR